MKRGIQGTLEVMRIPRLIDADALWDKVLEHTKDGDVIHRIPPDFIDNAPTVDAEPVRHGRWIKYEHGSGIYCSECRHKRRYRDMYDNYCPNCGARMDKTEGDAK